MSDDRIEEADALIAFGASNVWSYRDRVHLSLQATRLSNKHIARCVKTAGDGHARVLPVAGIFGANASGKSTALKAMADMAHLVRQSFRQAAPGGGVQRVPFLLDGESDRKPSSYQVEVVVDGVAWLYGFDVDSERVLKEYAYHYPKRRQRLLFERDGKEVRFGSPLRPIGRAVVPLLVENALLLSIMGKMDEGLLSPLSRWFDSNLMLADSENRQRRSAFTAILAETSDSRRRILDLIRAADLGVTGLDLVMPDADVLERLRRALRMFRRELGEDSAEPTEDALLNEALQAVQLSHRIADGNRSLEPQYESLGTQVWVSLVGTLLRALDRGRVLLIDELDASLHPLLVDRLVGLFQNPRTNPRCAQLIFNSHDVALLDSSSQDAAPLRLGRDQIWLTEKDERGSTALYSLADFRTRKGEAIARRYLRGRYGAIPELDPSSFHRAARASDDAPV